MRYGSTEMVRRDFNVLFDSGSVSGLSDGQLLERFSGRCDEAGRLAFEAVVQRHGSMVLGVCRRMLGEDGA
ncbi:RNA polymerase sigma factor, partial [Singulisphaera rosea]